MVEDRAVDLAALAGHIGLGVLTTQAGRLIGANDAMCELSGYSEDEMQGLPDVAALFTPESRSLFLDLHTRAASGHVTITSEMTLVARDGAAVPVRAAWAAASAPAPGTTIDAVAIVRDLRGERAMTAQLHRMTLIEDRIGAGVIGWSRQRVDDPFQLRFTFANRAAHVMLELDATSPLGATLGDLFPNTDAADAERLLALCGTDRSERFEDVAFAVGGQHRLFRWQGLGLPDNAVAAVFEDVTNERASESRRRALLHRLVDTADEERRRLALDLHDDAVQQIAAGAILVEGLQRHPGVAQLPERLAATATALRTALAGLRRLVFELSPPELVESGLDAAIRSAADYLFTDSTTTISVDVDLSGLWQPLTTPVETAAFRITAEALTNVYKHARASHVAVSIRADTEELHIVVEDDGVGVHAGMGALGHIGLRGMHERAAALGGDCSIQSGGRGLGTVVTASLPTAASPAPPTSWPSDPLLQPEQTDFQQQIDGLADAVQAARQDARYARRHLRAARALTEQLLNPPTEVALVTRSSVRLIGEAFDAACAIHLLSEDREMILHSASWHADPAQLAGLNTVAFADRQVSMTHARTVLAGGGAVQFGLESAAEEVRRHAPELPYEPHTAIIAALEADGRAIGTIIVVRDQTPERFSDSDLEFITMAAAQIGAAVGRSTAATDK